MRLAQLDLTRFGKFADKTLTFPKSPVDLHLIVGGNEAGKSTTLQAILDLFYGIPRNTTLGFRHGMTELVIGGRLENGGEPLSFQRFKRNKQPLMNAAGEPLSEGDLLKWLGGSDRAFYERNFGLNHHSLVEGAKQILNSSGDVGQMLFQAAAGLSGLHKVRSKLEEEGRQLWGERKRGDAAYYAGLNRMEEAETLLREVSVSANKWQTARRELESATNAATAAINEYREVEARRERLARIKRITPALQQMRAAQAERDALGHPAPLPSTAQRTLDDAESEIAYAEADQRRVGPLLAAAKAALGSVRRNPALVAHGAAIGNLAGRVTQFLKASSDLPGVQGQLDAKIVAVQASARQIGWAESDVAAIAAKLPTRLVRSEIEALLRTRQATDSAVGAAEKAESGQKATIKTLDETVAALPASAPSPAVAAALDAAKALDLTQAQAKAQKKITDAWRLADVALASLAPWTGDADALRRFPLHLTAEAFRNVSTRDGLTTRYDLASENLQAKRAEVARLNVAADEARRHAEPVTMIALTGQRTKRDNLWQEFRTGSKAPTTDGTAYEAEVIAADSLADRRYGDAAVIEHAQALDTQVKALEAEIGVLQEQLTAQATALTALRTTWDACMQAVGLPGMTPEHYPAWIKQREAALTAAKDEASARAELADLLARAAAAETALRDALTDAGQSATELGLDLAALVRRASEFEARQIGLRAELKGWQTQRQTAAAALLGLSEQSEAARKARQQWQEKWAQRIAAAGLPADIGTAGAQPALEMLQEVETACAAIRELQGRTGPMGQEIERFTRDATLLATTCMPEIAALPPAEIAASLSEGLRLAQQAETDHTRLAGEVTKFTADNAKAGEDIARGTAKIAPLLDIAHTTTRDELRAAIQLADACRFAETRARDAAATVQTGGDNLPLDRLVAEVDSEDPALLALRLEEAQTARKTAEERRDEAVKLRTQAEGAFEKIAGQDTAAKAESMRQDALLSMGDAADEYVRITLGVKLLKWAVEKYSAEKQDPLLRLASGTFKTLTCDAFDKLSLDFEATPVALTAHRSDGGMITVGDMSSGTEDQLYLALRLAALELHLESATALPFIADDIFVHWDNVRTGAGFAALAKLAIKTQVIVLTHHDNLVEIARRATDDKVCIHQL